MLFGMVHLRRRRCRTPLRSNMAGQLGLAFKGQRAWRKKAPFRAVIAPLVEAAVGLPANIQPGRSLFVAVLTTLG